MGKEMKDARFPSPPYYVSKECKLIPEAVDKELTRLDGLLEEAIHLIDELNIHGDHLCADEARDWLDRAQGKK